MYSQLEKPMQIDEEQKSGLIMAAKELAWNNQEKADLAYALIKANKMLVILRNEIDRLNTELKMVRSSIEKNDQFSSL